LLPNSVARDDMCYDKPSRPTQFLLINQYKLIQYKTRSNARNRITNALLYRLSYRGEILQPLGRQNWD